MSDHNSRYSTLRVAGRFVAGRDLDGRMRSTATFLYAGEQLGPRRVSRWACLPGWKRSAIRLGATSTASAALWGWVEHREATEIVLLSAGVLLVALVLLLLSQSARQARHYRRYVRPLAVALGPRIGQPETARPGAWLSVPVGFRRQEDAEIRVKLPDKWADHSEARRDIEQVVASKLGIGDLDSEFRTVGHPVAIFRRAPRPPDRVSFADVQAVVTGSPEHSPLIGLGERDAPVRVELDSESPHVLVSAGTGGGKSALLRLLLAQGLHNGGVGLVLDVKRISHAWSRDLRNVLYCRSIEDVHTALLAAKDEVDRRYEIIEREADDDGNADHVDVGPRLFILAEEMNATINRLQNYWKEIKTKEDPAASPAVQALGDILFMGRQGRVHVIAVAQLMTARTLGGPEARENFAVRILARYTRNAWKMLVPEVWPPPKASRHAGRVQVALAGIARETQVAFIRAAEARAWAQSGTVIPFPAAIAEAMGRETEGRPTSEAAEAGLHLVTEDQEAPVGLAAAIAAGLVTGSIAAVRQARQRDAAFPRPRGKRGTELLYAAAELAEWESTRQNTDTEATAGA